MTRIASLARLGWCALHPGRPSLQLLYPTQPVPLGFAPFPLPELELFTQKGFQLLIQNHIQ